MEPVKIRPAVASDLEPIVAFQRAMARETEGKDLDADRVTRGVRAALTPTDGKDRGTYLVAEVSGRVVASLLVTYEWSDWRDGWFWWIQSVYVRPEDRGRGIYRALYTEVLHRARSGGGVCGVRLYVETENQRAQAVYEKLGMVRAHYHMYEVDFVL